MKTCFSYNRTVKWQRFIRNDYAPGGRPTRVPLFAAAYRYTRDRWLGELLPFPYIARVLDRMALSLYRQLNSSPLKTKRKKRTRRLIVGIFSFLREKMTSNIRIHVEAVVLRLVGTLSYDLSRIHRYSKLFETWGTSVGEFPIAAPYSRSNTNVRLRVVDCTRDSGNSHLAGGPRAPIGRIGVDTRECREVCTTNFITDLP